MYEEMEPRLKVQVFFSGKENGESIVRTRYLRRSSRADSRIAWHFTRRLNEFPSHLQQLQKYLCQNFDPCSFQPLIGRPPSVFHLYPGKVDVCKYAILRPIRLSDIYLSHALTPQFEWCMRNNHRACCWLNSPRIFKINPEMHALKGTYGGRQITLGRRAKTLAAYCSLRDSHECISAVPCRCWNSSRLELGRSSETIRWLCLVLAATRSV
jgi:hypothetical protein